MYAGKALLRRECDDEGYDEDLTDAGVRGGRVAPLHGQLTVQSAQSHRLQTMTFSASALVATAEANSDNYYDTRQQLEMAKYSMSELAALKEAMNKMPLSDRQKLEEDAAIAKAQMDRAEALRDVRVKGASLRMALEGFRNTLTELIDSGIVTMDYLQSDFQSSGLNISEPIYKPDPRRHKPTV